LDHPPVTCPTAPGALGPEPGPKYGGNGAGGVRHGVPMRLGRFRNKMWKRLDLTIQNSDTNASVKSYQLVKVVSGGRAPGKSSSLASPQLLVIEQFHCFGAVRLE
jgi:hypothetical protein